MNRATSKQELVPVKSKITESMNKIDGSLRAIKMILALILVFLAMVMITRIVSLSSITVAALYPVFTFVYFTLWGNGEGMPWLNTLFAAILGGIIIYMHRANIKRLRNGTEYKFGEKKKEP